MQWDDDKFFDDGGLPLGEPIDITPKDETARPQKQSTDIDFDSDKPLIEQMLETHKLDRSDKTQQNKGCLANATLALLVFLIFLLLIYLIMG